MKSIEIFQNFKTIVDIVEEEEWYITQLPPLGIGEDEREQTNKLNSMLLGRYEDKVVETDNLKHNHMERDNYHINEAGRKLVAARIGEKSEKTGKAAQMRTIAKEKEK